MPANPLNQVELESGERTLHGWPVEMVGGHGMKGGQGWLVLTNRRCLFFRQAGLFGGGRLVKPPTFTTKLEQIHSATPRQYSIPMGYGEHLDIPGIEVDGREFKLNRETPSEPVLAEIAAARRARKVESAGALP